MEFLSKEEQILTATSDKGDTNILVCQNQPDKGKLCLEVENEPAGSTFTGSPQKGMLDNNTYDLLEQLTIENKSLWRIRKNYKSDASSDNETKQLWDLIEKDKEELVKLLAEKLKERL